MDELLELAKQHAAQELEIRRTCREIREKADKLGYEEAYVIDDPIHFQIAGIRFTPKRIFGEACKAPEQPEGTPASMPVDVVAESMKLTTADDERVMAEMRAFNGSSD